MDKYGYKVVGPNGNSITFPAAGHRYCDGDVGGVGTFGHYWSSTPNDSDYAWNLYFHLSAVDVNGYSRCYGFYVRLVQ